MNLVQFLKQVDMSAGELTKVQLTSFVHETARALPEEDRPAFLRSLLAAGNAQGSKISTHSDSKSFQRTIHERTKEMMEELEAINDGDRLLDSGLNEEWDEWYDEEEDEFRFSDPEEILPDIESAIALVHRCLDNEAYEDGAQLAEQLSELQVGIEGEYTEYADASFHITELYAHELLHGSLPTLARESMYLAYMANEPDDRPAALFNMMYVYRDCEVKLQDIMQTGEHDLPDFQNFLPKWISFLSRRTGRDTVALLKEAMELSDDDTVALKVARQAQDTHPELYIQILQKGMNTQGRVHNQNEKENSRALFAIGTEALNNIPVSYSIRANAALLTADLALQLQDGLSAEKCWMEALRSDTTWVNYLRLRLFVADWTAQKKSVEEVCANAHNTILDKSWNRPLYEQPLDNPLRKNTLYKNDWCAMLFFSQQFDRAIQEGLNQKEALGWSSSFMKEGISLFLLLLYEGENLPKGLQYLQNNKVIPGLSFDAKRFLQGTGVRTEQAVNPETFRKAFLRWKAETIISEEAAGEWITRLEHLVWKRVAGIMGSNRRNYYGESAAFVAGLGEMLQSRNIRPKDEVMAQYKAEYSRRRAFHEELRQFGMRK